MPPTEPTDYLAEGPPRVHDRLALIVRMLGVTLAFTLFVRGLAYVGPAARPDTPAGLVPLERLLPVAALAGACFVVAAVIIAGMFFRRLWTAGLLGYLVLQGSWTFSYFVSTWAGAPRGWVTATNYVPELVAALSLLLIGPPASLIEKVRKRRP